MLSGLFLATLPAAANELPLNGYYAYEIRRTESERVLHSSPLFLKSSGLRLSVFRTIEVDPLGSYWRCRGMGCDRKVQDKIGSLLFMKDAQGLTVIKADGAVKFLLGSSCRLINGPLGVQLGCQSSNAPWSQDYKSFVIFSPGS